MKRQTSGSQREGSDFVAEKARHCGKLLRYLKSGDGRQDILISERLLDERGAAMRVGQLLTHPSGDEGEGDPARAQRIGHRADGLSGEVDVEERTVDAACSDSAERVGDRPYWADRDKTRLLERTRNVQGDEEFILDDEYSLGRHARLLCSYQFNQLDGQHQGESPGRNSHAGVNVLSGARQIQPCAIFEPRRTPMNWDRIEGNWKQFRGKVQQQWGKLTDDDLDLVEGRRVELVGKIQERYGIAKDEAERQVDSWSNNA